MSDNFIHIVLSSVQIIHTAAVVAADGCSLARMRAVMYLTMSHLDSDCSWINRAALHVISFINRNMLVLCVNGSLKAFFFSFKSFYIKSLKHALSGTHIQKFYKLLRPS